MVTFCTTMLLSFLFSRLLQEKKGENTIFTKVVHKVTLYDPPIGQSQLLVKISAFFEVLAALTLCMYCTLYLSLSSYLSLSLSLSLYLLFQPFFDTINVLVKNISSCIIPLNTIPCLWKPNFLVHFSIDCIEKDYSECVCLSVGTYM